MFKPKKLKDYQIFNFSTIKPNRIMQNSIPLPPEEDYAANIIVRIVTAFRVLTAKKAVIIIGNQIDIFNMEKPEILAVASQIVGEIASDMFEDMEQDLAIQNLVYGS
jgi:hypothetical protein